MDRLTDRIRNNLKSVKGPQNTSTSTTTKPTACTIVILSIPTNSEDSLKEQSDWGLHCLSNSVDLDQTAP